ncbi:MAG: TIGR02452 family protein [Treponema sp.]|nr:TIGR02452 family protein [Treponema sp.]
MSHFDNIAIFEDTVDLCQKNPRLQEQIRASIEKQQFIAEKDFLPDGSEKKRFDTPAKILVSKKRTFEAAKTYTACGDKIAVLNFASSTNPGGGVVHGSRAQEESLCRCSTLYFTLNTDENWNRFYNPHRINHNPLHNDDILYSPGITVVKTDTDSPRRMDESDWYTVDVITCAAPNLHERPSNRYNPGDGEERLSLSDDELASLHEKRDLRIFDVAVQHKVDVLILGAFGCGAFRNNPQVVAKVMAKLAKKYEKAFRQIEFAVFCPPYLETANYQEFVRAFS